MRHLALATLLAAGLMTGPLSRPAAAVTLEELFSLKANGLSDDILVALIETDGSMFQLLPEDVVELYRRGLSERVILAMIATARRQSPPQAQPSPGEIPVPAPVAQTLIQPVQVVNSAPVEVYVPVAVPVSVYVPVGRNRSHDSDKPQGSSTYWGFGGQLRPDAWGQPRRQEPQKSSGDSDRGRDRTPEPTDRSSSSRRR
jgi:hypothetical protein